MMISGDVAKKDMESVSHHYAWSKYDTSSYETSGHDLNLNDLCIVQVLKTYRHKTGGNFYCNLKLIQEFASLVLVTE